MENVSTIKKRRKKEKRGDENASTLQPTTMAAIVVEIMERIGKV